MGKDVSNAQILTHVRNVKIKTIISLLKNVLFNVLILTTLMSR